MTTAENLIKTKNSLLKTIEERKSHYDICVQIKPAFKMLEKMAKESATVQSIPKFISFITSFCESTMYLFDNKSKYDRAIDSLINCTEKLKQTKLSDLDKENLEALAARKNDILTCEEKFPKFLSLSQSFMDNNEKVASALDSFEDYCSKIESKDNQDNIYSGLESKFCEAMQDSIF